MRAVRALCIATGSVALAVGVVACAGGDTSLYVKNDSTQAWYLSVAHRNGPDTSTWVVKVSPGADTFALSWNGGDSVPVSVLALDCTVVGTFRVGDGGAWVIDSVAGLTGRIENNGTPLGSRTTTPGVVDTEDCGGSLSH